MAAIVLLPEPDTPMTTSTLMSLEVVPEFISSLRRGSLDHEPDEIAVRIGTMRRQIFAGKHTFENRAFIGAVDQKQHFTRGSQCRESQRDTRHEWLHSGFRNAKNPAVFFFERGRVRKQRRCVAIGAEAHQHEIEQRLRRLETACTVKLLKLVFVKTRGAFG